MHFPFSLQKKYSVSPTRSNLLKKGMYKKDKVNVPDSSTYIFQARRRICEATLVPISL